MTEHAASLFQQLDYAQLPPVVQGRSATSESMKGENSTKQSQERYFATDWNTETKIVLSQQLAEKEALEICKKGALPKRTENMGWESLPGRKYAPVQGNRDFMKLRERIKNERKQGLLEEKVEVAIEQLVLGIEVSGTARYNVDMCYFVRMMQPTATLVITLVPTNGDPDLYCSTKVVATHRKFQWRSMLMTGRDQIEITPKDTNFICGNYYITVCNRGLDTRPASYLLKAHVKSRILETLMADRQVIKTNRLHMKQLKIATGEADDKVNLTSVASGWGKWRNCGPKPEMLIIDASRTMTPSIRSTTTPNIASDLSQHQSDLKAAIELDMTSSTKPFMHSFLDRSRLIFEKPVSAIEQVLQDVGSTLVATASQQMFREGTKLMLSRALYSKQPHFGKNIKNVKRSDRNQPIEHKPNDSDSEDEILFGGTDPIGKPSLDIDAFVSVGIPPEVLKKLMDSSDFDVVKEDNSTQWLVGIGKNVPSVKEILEASTVSAILPYSPIEPKFFGFRSGEHLRRIKELCISGCQNILSTQLLKATAVMVMLETLDISNCDQLGTDDLLKIMNRLPLLDNLNISNCRNINGLIFDRLTEFPNLRAVRSCSNQQIEFESVSRFLGSSTKINHISLSRSHIFKRTLTPLELCSSIDNLDVSSCGLSIDILAMIIEKMPNLRSIACANTKSKHPANANAFFANLFHMHSIDVSFCTWVTSAHLVGLSQSSPHLQSLLAAGLHELRDWVIVEMFQNCGHIHILDCEGWNISDTGLEALASLGQELCEVSFKAVKDISIEGVEMLLVGCKNICKLNVTKCPKIDQDDVAEATLELCDHYVSVSKQ